MVPSSADPTAVIEPPADPPAYAVPQPAEVEPVPTSAPVGWVIAAMILFWPTGIPALLASHRAARAVGAADRDVALHERARARRWSIVSVVVGGVLIVASVLVSIVWVALLAVAVHDRGDDIGPGRGPGFSRQLPFDGPRGRGQTQDG